MADHGEGASQGFDPEIGNVEAEDESGGILFFMAALFIGIILRRLKHLIPLPYTFLVFLCGVVAGVIVHEGSAGRFEASVAGWTDLHPEILFFIFLPPLIFSSAFEADQLIFTREITRILLLAGPGVLVATMLTAGYVLWIFHYDWDFTTAVTFGAMLSATDPVAVVALLKELGAPKTLSLFIEGESLFNDGTAMALFLAFKESILGHEQSAGEVIVFFIRLAFGGAALGLVLGFIVVYLLQWVRFDVTGQTTVTIIAAFGTFIIAEGSDLEVSGVISVVVMGLVVGMYGKPYIEDHHVLSAFWATMEFLADTVVFFLSGIFVYSGFRSGSIGGYEWGMLFGLYAALMLIRALSILVSYSPFARLLSDSPNTPHTGLRGAVGLVLALSIEEEAGLSVALRERFVFYMSGIAMLTLGINGTTAGLVVTKLGLTKMSKASQEILDRAIGRIEERTSAMVASLRHEDYFQGCDFQRGEKFVPEIMELLEKERRRLEKKTGVVLSDKEEKELLTRAQTMANLAEQRIETHGVSDEEEEDISPGPSHANENPKLKQAWLEVARHRFLNLVRSEYWSMYDKGYLSDNVVGPLVDAASISQQKRHEPLIEWHHLNKSLASSRMSLRIRKVLGCGTTRFLTPALRFQLESSAGFLRAHSAVEDRFRLIMADQVIHDQVIQESRKEMEKADKVMRDVEQTYPEVARAVKTQRLFTTLVRHAREVTKELLHVGELQETDFEKINEKLEEKEKTLKLPRKILMDDKSLIRDVGLFYQLDDHTLSQLVKIASHEDYQEGDSILQQNEKPTFLVVVLRGSVSLYREWEDAVEGRAQLEYLKQSIGASAKHASMRELPRKVRSRSDETGDPFAAREDKKESEEAKQGGDEQQQKEQEGKPEESKEGEGKLEQEGKAAEPEGQLAQSKKVGGVNLATLFQAGSRIAKWNRLRKAKHDGKVDKSTLSPKKLRIPALKRSSSAPETTPHRDGSPSIELRELKIEPTQDDAHTHHTHHQHSDTGEDTGRGTGVDRQTSTESGGSSTLACEKCIDEQERHTEVQPSEQPEMETENVIELASGLGRGTLLGFLPLITEERMYMTVKADTHVVCLKIEKHRLDHLLRRKRAYREENEEEALQRGTPVETVLCKMAGLNIAKLFLGRFGSIPHHDIRMIIAHAGLIRPRPYRPYRLEGGGILLTGQALEPKRGIQESKEADGEGYSQKKEGLSSIPVWKASRSLGKSRHGATSEKDVITRSAASSNITSPAHGQGVVEEDDIEKYNVANTEFNVAKEKMFTPKAAAFTYIEFNTDELHWFSPGSRVLILPKRIAGVTQNTSRLLRRDWAHVSLATGV